MIEMKRLKTVKSILLSMLCVALLFACAAIPQQEQLVSSTSEIPLSRNSGNCTETDFYSDNRGTGRIPPELASGSISILDWNIYKGQRQDWDVDLLELSRAKDLIFLQEAPLNEKLRYMLGYKDLYWNLNSALKFKGAETGVLIASAIKPLKSCGLRRSEPIIGVPKTILINSYQIVGLTEKLLVANIHGINITFGTGAYRQQLDALEAVLEQHEGPILLVGDFNNWSEKRTAIMLQLAENLSLQFLDFNHAGRTTFWGEPVDQILFRGLEPVTRAVHPVTSSDHNPLTATFRFVRGDDATKNEPH